MGGKSHRLVQRQRGAIRVSSTTGRAGGFVKSVYAVARGGNTAVPRLRHGGALYLHIAVEGSTMQGVGEAEH